MSHMVKLLRNKKQVTGPEGQKFATEISNTGHSYHTRIVAPNGTRVIG